MSHQTLRHSPALRTNNAQLPSVAVVAVGDPPPCDLAVLICPPSLSLYLGASYLPLYLSASLRSSEVLRSGIWPTWLAATGLAPPAQRARWATRMCQTGDGCRVCEPRNPRPLPDCRCSHGSSAHSLVSFSLPRRPTKFWRPK